MDQDTHRVKTATHVVFDEANYTLAKPQCTSASQALIDLSYAKEDFTTLPPITTSPHPTTTVAHIQLLSSLAKLPVRGSTQAAGYDVFSMKSCQLEPQMITEIPLDITIQLPPGTYVQILPRSGLAQKGISIYAGIIDPDYRGNIIVLLHNSSSKALPVQQGDRIAQIIFKHYSPPDLALTTNIDHTPRGAQGFGSTGTADIPTSHTITQKDLAQDMPYNIYLSDDPFDDYISITVQDFGSHDTLGMVLQQCPHRQRPQLLDILPSHPMSRVKHWRRNIKRGYCMQIEEYVIYTVDDVKSAIAKCRQKILDQICLQFSIDSEPGGIHPTEGTPMMFYDQLSVVAAHVHDVMQ